MPIRSPNPFGQQYPSIAVQQMSNFWLLVLTILALTIKVVRDFYGPEYVMHAPRFEGHISELIFSDPDFTYFVRNKTELSSICGIMSVADGVINSEEIQLIKAVINSAANYVERHPGALTFEAADYREYRSVASMVARFWYHRITFAQEMRGVNNNNNDEEEEKDDEKEETDDEKEETDDDEQADADGGEDAANNNVLDVPAGIQQVCLCCASIITISEKSNKHCIT